MIILSMPSVADKSPVSVSNPGHNATGQNATGKKCHGKNATGQNATPENATRTKCHPGS